jgi:hypothetical protein
MSVEEDIISVLATNRLIAHINVVSNELIIFGITSFFKLVDLLNYCWNCNLVRGRIQV